MIAKTMLRPAALAAIILASTAHLSSAETVYHRGNVSEPETLDQHRTSTVYEANILRDLYEGLVVYDAGANIIPGVAETWETSDDGLVYTFHLRPDAKWSNGDNVVPDDFVFSLRRIMDPATGARYANILYPIKNAEAVNKGETAKDELGVEALDPQTLEITLENPTPFFIELLTHQTGLPVHPASVGEHGDEFVRPENMVSNGAYTLSDWIINGHIELSKNPEFHDADNVAIETVYYYPTEDRSAALRRFQAGELHTQRDAPADQLDWIRENLGEQLRVAPYLGVEYYALNMGKEALGNPDVRRALSMAIDRELIAEDVWSGARLPGYSFVPPGIGNYGDPAYADYKDLPMLDREDEALALLEGAGYGPDNPIDLELRYNTSENHKNTAVAIADMWKPLGVNVSLYNSDTATHYAHLRDKGDFDVARAAWLADYSDPQSFLFMLESDNTGFNYANYNNPEYDSLMDQAAATTDLEERAKLLLEAEKIFMRDLPFIPLLYWSSINLVSPKVKGWEDNVQDVHATRWLSIED